MTSLQERRMAGILIPVFALRSQNDLGIGDTRSLTRFIDWASRIGFQLIQTLPINETGGDNSPYNAISSMALDPTLVTLDPEWLEDVTPRDIQTALSEVDISQLHTQTVDYSLVKPLKQKILLAAFKRFEKKHLIIDDANAITERAKSFQGFKIKEAAWLEGYTLFRLLMEENGNNECWDQWPKEQQTFADAQKWYAQLCKKNKRKASTLEKRRNFYAYVQWIAYQQWEKVRTHAQKLNVALMGDIPLGVSYYSADYWSHPELFKTGWSGGAPPETYFKDDLFTQKWGQNWGIPVYDWEAMKQNDYQWWRQRVSGIRHLFHIFRIDHILGFYRIYSFPWRPHQNAEFLHLSYEQAKEKAEDRLPQFLPRGDETPENCAANCKHGETLLRMVLESARETIVIGEDLGTVPQYVRPSLAALGIAGFKIPIWENERPENYAPLSLATYGTHDHEPLRTLWNRLQREQSWEEIHKLCNFAGIPHDSRQVDFAHHGLHACLLEALFRTGSQFVVCMVSDLLGTEERFNVPGTAAKSNWSRRMQFSLEELETHPGVIEWTKQLHELLLKTNRIPVAV